MTLYRNIIVVSAERRPLLDVGLPQKRGDEDLAESPHLAIGVAIALELLQILRERCCPSCSKVRSRLLRHPRKVVGWCDSMFNTTRNSIEYLLYIHTDCDVFTLVCLILFLYYILSIPDLFIKTLSILYGYE